MANERDRARQSTEFTSTVYFDAAKELAGSLQNLYDSQEYKLAIYNAGVAFEAMLRAYRARINPEFSARHDLYELAKEAKFAEIVPAAMAEKYAADLGAVAVRWSNNHRYRSEAALRRYLKRAGLDRRIKGDPLKENARLAVNAAIELVSLGVRLWKR